MKEEYTITNTILTQSAPFTAEEIISQVRRRTPNMTDIGTKVSCRLSVLMANGLIRMTGRHPGEYEVAPPLEGGEHLSTWSPFY